MVILILIWPKYPQTNHYFENLGEFKQITFFDCVKKWDSPFRLRLTQLHAVLGMAHTTPSSNYPVWTMG